MILARRKFVQGSALGLVALTSMFGLAGCVDLVGLVNIITASLSSLQTILGTTLPPAAAAILTTVKAGLADLSAAIAQYDAAPASDKATLIGKIDTILSAIVTNFNSFISQVLPGAGTLVTLIEGIATLVLSTIAGIRNDLPTPTPAPSTVATPNVMLSRGAVTVTPVKRDKKQYRKAFNALVDAAGHQEAELH